MTEQDARPLATPCDAGERAFVIGLLGAESTGKTTLCEQLSERLSEDGLRVAVVHEYLRAFCEDAGRPPHVEEQAAIAAEQTHRIGEAARSGVDIVIADTTALMIAVYSDHVFADRSLYAAASAAHERLCDLTLLTALDIPWVDDGLQREGPHVREPIDDLIREALRHAGISWSLVSGSGPSRTAAALAAIRHGLSRQRMRPVDQASNQAPVTQAASAMPARWQAHCEHCGDPACEGRLLKLRELEPLAGIANGANKESHRDRDDRF